MNITEAKIKFVSDKTDKLKAFCSITIDREFVIRDIKVIEGARGCFVAMPSRKLMDRCPSCGGKNHLRAQYCNDCGAALKPDRVGHDEEGRPKLHADVAHPINSSCRDRLQRAIIEAYDREVELSKNPDYVPPSDEEVFGVIEDGSGGRRSGPRTRPTAPASSTTPGSAAAPGSAVGRATPPPIPPRLPTQPQAPMPPIPPQAPPPEEQPPTATEPDPFSGGIL